LISQPSTIICLAQQYSSHAAAAALLSARSGPLLRSASAVVTMVSQGFHVFRIDGYSCSTTIPEFFLFFNPF
jgi:hypothetical protein